MLIAFCGIDGTGKSSHSKEIGNWLRNKGIKIKDSNLISDNHLFYDTFKQVTNMYEEKYEEDTDEGFSVLLAFEFFRRAKEVEKDISDGIGIIADRWTYCHYAYNYARNVNNKFANLLLDSCCKPDLVFLLDLPVNAALERIDRRGSRSYNETTEVLEKAREKYLEIAKEEKAIILDSADSFEYNQKIIKNIIKDKFEI
ncbi:dTMP kinase [Clostridium cavendishii DSM 21758]|uniref:Thymidylate kinase n=1 Tax=Clostridium cavendishii DSM 21758 TaxID=1121302 RepID=A0A1M6JEC8_9CLOT|nr:dTMP kinase [Clostridium cavendishii]SHJ45073.1 dTMP kinase [Clostridium cavendishii DSM 21758]